VNWLFRRHFWIVHLVFLSITAIITAKTVTTLAGYWLSKKIPQKSVVSSQIFEEEEVVIRNFEKAAERNLFAARREKVTLAEEEGEEAQVMGRWQDAGPTSLPLTLISTMVFDDPYESRAVIQDSSGDGRVFSLLECVAFYGHDAQIETVLPAEDWEPSRACNNIFGMATLKRIEEFRVIIYNERARKYEYISLIPEDQMARRMKVPETEEFVEGSGVRQTGPTSFQIDQSEFDKALSNIARLMTEARAVPETDANGKYVGFKIVYLKEGSLFEKIGIGRNDVLTRINGYDLDSPEKALQLFSKLRVANQFTIDIKRGDRATTLDYSVVR
jgi:general secretion pathway protein C